MGEVRRARLQLVTVLLVAVATMIAPLVWMKISGADGPLAKASGSDRTGFSAFAIGKRPQVPSVEGRTIDGQPLAIRDLRGHVVVLNVWGSWCAPCRAEAPDLAAVSRETAAQGVRFIGIDVRDNPASARAFARRFKIPYPSFDDQDTKVLDAFSGLIPIRAVPSTLIVDRHGRVAARVVGRVDAATLRTVIGDLVTESAHPGSSGAS